jgi:hypothetical protein
MGVARATASQLLLGASSILLVVSVAADVCGEHCVTVEGRAEGRSFVRGFW